MLARLVPSARSAAILVSSTSVGLISTESSGSAVGGGAALSAPARRWTSGDGRIVGRAPAVMEPAHPQPLGGRARRSAISASSASGWPSTGASVRVRRVRQARNPHSRSRNGLWTEGDTGPAGSSAARRSAWKAAPTAGEKAGAVG